VQQQPTTEQLHEAIRRADAAGDAGAVKLLAQALKEGKTQEQINQLAQAQGLKVDQASLKANIASRDAGGATSDFLAPDRGALEQLGDATAVTLKGGAKGIAGPYDLLNTAAGGVQKGITYGITHGPAFALDALGAEELAEVFRTAGNNRIADIDNTTNTMSVRGALDRISPTPNGLENVEFASEIAAGMAVPLGPKVRTPTQAPKATPKTPSQQVVNSGREHGVRVMTSDTTPPRNFVSRNVRTIGERIPIAGTGGTRAKQAQEQVEAVRNLAEDFGVEVTGNYVEDVARDFVANRSKQLTALTKRKNNIIDGVQGAFTSPRATAEIDNQISRLSAIDDSAFSPVVQRLEGFKSALQQGKSLSEVEGQRRLLGDLFEDASLASIRGDGQKAINAIYAPLRDDMANFIRQNGGEEAHKRWSTANKKLAEMAGELDVSAFKRALNNASATPEDVAGLLFSKKPSDVSRLYRSLSASGKTKAQAAIIHRAFAKATDGAELSAQKFASEIERLGGPIGVAFDKSDRASIEGLSRLLKATRQATVASANPPTGTQNSMIIGSAVLTDWLGTAGAAMATAGGAGLAARAYESAPVRNLMINLGKTKPGSEGEKAIFERIARVMTVQSGVEGGAIARAVNDNPASRLAAEEQQPEE